MPLESKEKFYHEIISIMKYYPYIIQYESSESIPYNSESSESEFHAITTGTA
jgi:hypothetical protein